MHRLLLVLLVGCAGDHEIERHYIDAGTLCFAQGPFGKEIVVDKPTAVFVQLDACLSSSCDVDRDFVCSTKVVGDQITITSSLRWTSRGGSCTLDCGVPLAECELPPLPAGTYAITFGDTKQTLQVPSVAPACAD